MADHPLLAVYARLAQHFGPQHWWPGETPFEIMVGAVLTQNTSWTNAAQAISNLQAEGLLSVEALLALPDQALAERIVPCGYYNLKTRRLKNLLNLIGQNYDGRLENLFALELSELREALLAVKGIGPETADSIILYAAGKPIFVVDTYTHRILSRHQLIDEDEADYHQIQELFMEALPADPALFNEYHALLVQTGKNYCKKSRPLCDQCPLQGS